MKEILEPDRLSQFFHLANDQLEEPTRSAVMLLPCTGLRSIELASLRLQCFRWVPLKMDNGTEAKMLAVVSRAKGGDEKVTPVLTEGVEIISTYLTGWRRAQPDTKWLFPGKSEHLATRTMRAALQRIREPLGLVFSPHTMRRTYLTGLYRRGVPAEILQKISGHKDIDTLIRHYLALDPHDSAKAVYQAGGTLLG
jgi:integrase